MTEEPKNASVPKQRGVFKPGRNCPRISQVERGKVLIDGANYFAQLDACFETAGRSIVIVGWDFDANTRLTPDLHGGGISLGDRLRSLVDERPDLEIHILVWSLAAAHGPSRGLPLILGEQWHAHPRIHLKLDRNHPIFGSHHQKIVIVDGTIGFTGGIDLTVGRWDTPHHPAHDLRRNEGEGDPTHPVHDCQIMISGPIVNDLTAIAVKRWRAATGAEPNFAGVPMDSSWWPKRETSDLEHVPAAVATTEPGLWRRKQSWHSAILAADVFRTARSVVYIENQYFAGELARQVLPDLLLRENGPEIVVVTTNTMNGRVEQISNGRNRDRLIRHLKRFDRHDRLRVFYPVRDERGKRTEIFIHSKIAIVDDHVLRIGSANLNNRSIGVDSECDVAIEANRSQASAAIAGIRYRLIAEHLGVGMDTLLGVAQRAGSLIAAIEKLNGGTRSLVPFPALCDRGQLNPGLGTRLFDPIAPYGSLKWLRGSIDFSAPV
ncbi:phospholipase D-like domain-containing protein [Fulvimarina pelagi]|nr:phospholipase D-like domain-containing protein [Fulvimarina pelagi]